MRRSEASARAPTRSRADSVRAVHRAHDSARPKGGSDGVRTRPACQGGAQCRGSGCGRRRRLDGRSEQVAAGGVDRLLGRRQRGPRGGGRGGRRFGSLLLSPPHAAVRPTIATMAAPPTAAAMRRARRFDLMFGPLLVVLDVVNLRSARVAAEPCSRSHPEVGSGVRNSNARAVSAHSLDQAYSGSESVMPLWRVRPLLTVSSREGVYSWYRTYFRKQLCRMVREVLLWRRRWTWTGPETALNR